MKRIQRAIIPAAGLAIPFLPATKTIPKEMLPIVDKPTLLYAVEELIAADIPELVLIAGRDKSSIEDYFDTSYELEDVLEKAGKRDLLNSIRSFRKRIKVISVRQQEPLGLGHAVLCAQSVIGKEPFALLLCDEVMIQEPGQPSAIAQLMQTFVKTGMSSVSVIEVADSDTSRYGMVATDGQVDGHWRVKAAVEKPPAGQAPSRLALSGRYVFDSEIFACLAEIQPDAGGEYQLSDALNLLAQRQGVLATQVNATRYDVRDKLGYMRANVEIALRHPELGPQLREYLKRRGHEGLHKV
jgi:UTP--glucose-1-phosphate uridylyltransferase